MLSFRTVASQECHKDAMLARMATVKELNRCWEDILDMATRHVFEKDAIIPHKNCVVFIISQVDRFLFFILLLMVRSGLL